MISKFWFIGDHADFYTSRSGKMGASDVPACITNPENPTESLAGYDRTALTVYQEKSGEVERSFDSNFNTEMGHHNENKSIEWLVRFVWSHEEGLRLRILKERYEADVEIARIENKPIPSARDYQTGGPFLHSVQYYVDGMIAHPDLLFIGVPELKGKKERFVTYNGVRFDLSKPFLVEGKSAKKYAAKRPHGSMVKGYDFDLMTWQGIPLKHYMQIQFQEALFQIPVCYLALIHDTSDFQIWKIDADKKTQGNIMDIVGKMVKHIELKTMPRELAMNGADVQIMYPDVSDDFIDISGWSEDRQKLIMKALKQNIESNQQQKNWKAKEVDSKDTLSVLMKEHGEIRKGSEKLAVWEFRKGSFSLQKIDKKSKVSFLNQMKKNDPVTYKYLERKGYIGEGKGSRHVAIKWKGEDE